MSASRSDERLPRANEAARARRAIVGYAIGDILREMATVVDFGHALYYPHIEFNNRKWLRTSSLYHDVIGRIVPSSFSPAWDGSVEAQLLRDDVWRLEGEGFLTSEYPGPFTATVANAFYELALANAEPERRAKLLPVLPNADEPFTLYKEKVDPTLLELMKVMHLARELDDHQVEADPIAGAIYMRTLAEHMAGQRPLITDDPVFEAMAYSPRTDESELRRDNGFLLANAVFRTVIPLDVEKVPLEDLVSFRRDHRDLRLGFQSEIKKMAADLAKLNRKDQIQQALDHYTDAVDASVNKLEAKLRLLKIGAGTACFSVSLPGWVTAGWGLGLTNPLVLVGTIGAVLAVTVTKSVLERQLTTGDSGFGYVHYLRRDLTPRQYAEGIVQLNLSARATQGAVSWGARARRFLRRLWPG